MTDTIPPRRPEPPAQADHVQPVALGGRAADYEARKLAQRCTRPGCSRPPAEDTQLCARHLRGARRASRASHRRRRAKLRAAGLCACGCGRKSETWYAPVCAIRLGRIPSPAVNPAVNHRPAPGPADPWRRDNDGWRRFRGKGKRGNPTAEVKDMADLDDAAKTIERARVAYQRARSPEVLALGRIQRQAAMDEADALTALAARALDALLTRHGK